MKSSRSAAVLAGVVLLAGGAVAADGATVTNPVKLCFHSQTGMVEVPKAGSCAKGATEFFVASSDDVQALAGRMDDVEDVNAAQDTAISAQETAIENSLDARTYSFTSHGFEVATWNAGPFEFIAGCRSEPPPGGPSLQDTLAAYARPGIYLELISPPDDGVNAGLGGGPVAYFGPGRETETVQLVDTQGASATVVVSHLRQDDRCTFVATISVSRP